MKEIKDIKDMLRKGINKTRLEVCVNDKGLVFISKKTRCEVDRISMVDIERFIKDSKLPRIGRNILLNSKSILEENGINEMVMLEYVGVNSFSDSYEDISLLLDNDCKDRDQVLDMIIEYVDFYFGREENHAYWLFEGVKDVVYNNGYDRKSTLEFFEGVKNREEEYKEKVIEEMALGLINDAINSYIYYTINDRDLGYKERLF